MRSPLTRITARRSEYLPPAMRSISIWVGPTGQRQCRLPNVLRWRRSGPTAKTLGLITRSAASILFTRRFDDSLAEFELALRLNPNFSLAQGYYGLTLSYCGRFEEADRTARRALRLSPRSILGDLYRHCRLLAVRRAQLRRGDAARTRGNPSAGRFHRRASGAHRRP